MSEIKSRRDLYKALFRVSSLDSRERKVVFAALCKDLDMGEITEFELDRTLRKLRKEKKIKEVDRRNIRNTLQIN